MRKCLRKIKGARVVGESPQTEEGRQNREGRAEITGISEIVVAKMMARSQAKDAPSRSSMLSKNGVGLIFL